MRLPLLLLSAIALSLAGACGQGAAASKSLSRDLVQPRTSRALEVTSTAVDARGAIDLRHTAYGDNLSVPLRWTAVEGARAYAIIIEDPDAPGPTPFVHWLIWNLPPGPLAEGLPAGARLAGGAAQGKNGIGANGYFGPRPPAGTGVHHYHLEVFALDGPLTINPETTDVRGLVDAMKGHTVAEGELVATFSAPSSP